MTLPVRMGILGCARIAQTALVKAAPQVPGLELLAVASRNLERSRRFASEHGIARAYGDYEALLADPQVDAVYIPLPNSLHCDWTIRALQAGKAVLCEKPLASNADEACRMRDAATQSGRPLVEAFHYRYHPLGIYLADLVKSGRLGPIRRIDAGLMIPGALVPRDDIRFDAGLSGGAMMDVGAYALNILRLISGQEPTITSARADLVASGVDGAMEAHMIFASGAVGSLRGSLVAGSLKAWLTIEGEGGRLEVDNPFLPQIGHVVVLDLGGKRSPLQFERTPTYVFQAREFVDVVRRGAPIRTTADDAVANMAAIDAIYEAAGLAPRG